MAFEKEFENLFRSFAESKEKQDRTSDLIDRLSLESSLRHAKSEELIDKLSLEGTLRHAKSEELIDRLSLEQAKTSELIDKLSLEQAKTDKQIQKLSKELGNISNNNGVVAEEFFWNALKSKKSFNGIKIDYSERNTHRKLGKIEDEFDIILYNCNSVIVVEVKYKVREQDIKSLRDRKIPNFKQLFKDKAKQNIYGVIAGWSFSKEVVNLAKEAGFFILRQSGDNIMIESDEIKAY